MKPLDWVEEEVESEDMDTREGRDGEVGREERVAVRVEKNREERGELEALRRSNDDTNRNASL